MGGGPLVPILLGTRVGELAGVQDQRRQQRRILNTSLADVENTQRNAVQQVTEEAQRMAPDARMQQMASAEQQAYDRTMADLASVGGAPVDPAAGAGNVSADVMAALASRRADEGARMSAIARELAKVRAPQDVATEAGLRRGAMAERLGSLWSSQRARSRAAQLDADAVEMPLYGQLSSLANQAAMAYAMGGGNLTGTGGASGPAAGGGMRAPASGNGWWIRG